MIYIASYVIISIAALLTCSYLSAKAEGQDIFKSIGNNETSFYLFMFFCWWFIIPLVSIIWLFDLAKEKGIKAYDLNKTNHAGINERALDLATKIHFYQEDKAGKPYIDHPIAVAGMVKGGDEKTVAVLHDVVEDTETTPPEALLQEIYNDFGRRIGDAVAAITHAEGESYKDYIIRVSKNKLAKTVKIADIDHNNSPARLANLPVRLQYGMACKHIRARHYLVTGEWYEDELVEQLIKYRYKKDD